MPILRQAADERYSATGFGIFNCASCLAGGVMIYVGGALKDANVNIAIIFQASAVGLALVAALLLFIKPASGTNREDV